MKYLLHFLFFLGSCSFFFLACAPQQSDQGSINRLEAALEQGEDNDLAKELVQEYLTYASKYPKEVELNGRYLYRAAALEYRMGNYAEAIKNLQKALEDYYESSNSGNSAALLASIYQDKLRNLPVATSIYQGMQIAFPDSLSNKFSFPANLPSVAVRLDSLRQGIFDEQTYGVNFQVANDYISSVESFALVAPKDPNTPALLFKAGEVARSIQTFSKAVDLLQWLHERYPDSEKDAQAMFLIAFTLDDGLKQFEDAKVAYEAFIAKYPNDPFADDAQFSLNNLGKDINELIDQFSEDQDQ